MGTSYIMQAESNYFQGQELVFVHNTEVWYQAPHLVKEALEIDQATGTDFWRKALNKEMSKVKVAWEVREGITPEDVQSGKVLALIGYQEIGCHVVFDVKMDFSRKARFVAGGHTTEAPDRLHIQVWSVETVFELDS